MNLLYVILILALVGFFLWAINAYVEMTPQYKNFFNGVVIFLVVIWLVFYVMAPLMTRNGLSP